MINLQALKANVDLEIEHSLLESEDTFRCTMGLAEMVSEGLAQAIDTDDVSVVRCKDCNHCTVEYRTKRIGEESVGEYICNVFGVVSGTFYCAMGVKRESSTLEKAIETYGKDMQLNVAIEEFSELIKEICKNKRGADNRDSILEELADCYIMMKQIEMIFGISKNEIATEADKKVTRLEKRLGEGEQSGQ